MQLLLELLLLRLHLRQLVAQVSLHLLRHVAGVLVRDVVDEDRVEQGSAQFKGGRLRVSLIT